MVINYNTRRTRFTNDLSHTSQLLPRTGVDNQNCVHRRHLCPRRSIVKQPNAVPRIHEMQVRRRPRRVPDHGRLAKRFKHKPQPKFRSQRVRIRTHMTGDQKCTVLLYQLVQWYPAGDWQGSFPIENHTRCRLLWKRVRSAIVRENCPAGKPISATQTGKTAKPGMPLRQVLYSLVLSQPLKSTAQATQTARPPNRKPARYAAFFVFAAACFCASRGAAAGASLVSPEASPRMTRTGSIDAG